MPTKDDHEWILPLKKTCETLLIKIGEMIDAAKEG